MSFLSSPVSQENIDLGDGLLPGEWHVVACCRRMRIGL